MNIKIDLLYLQTKKIKRRKINKFKYETAVKNFSIILFQFQEHFVFTCKKTMKLIKLTNQSHIQ